MVWELYLNKVVKKSREWLLLGKKGGEMQKGHTRVSGVADKVLFLGLGGCYKHVFVMTICAVF